MTAPMQTPRHSIDQIDGEWAVVRGVGENRQTVATHASEEAARVDARRRNAEHAAATGEPESPDVDPAVTTDERRAITEVLDGGADRPVVRQPLWVEPGQEPGL